MLKHFFIICSGADAVLLNKCADSEQQKYAGIGATVFFTAIMAFIASSYALYVVFDNYYIALLLGVVWGLLIFNLDRFIVSTLKKRDTFSSEFLQALPRLILAVIIAVVISKPLELKLFEKELNQVLLEQKNSLLLDNKEQISARYLKEVENLNKKKTQSEQLLELKKAEVDTLYKTYITEAEGTAGTKKIGKGPVYQEKRDKHDSTLADYKALKADVDTTITAIESRLAALRLEQDNTIKTTEPIIQKFDGLMARVNALNKLPLLPSLFIFLLFLAIETAPIFTKLIASKGEYDIKLEDYESSVKNWLEQQHRQRQLLAKTDDELNATIYKDITTDSEVYAYKSEKIKAVMRLQTDAFYKQQKSVL